MKKKIALLLAVIMTLSLMPMTVFAGSTNYLEKGTLTLKKDTRYDGTVSIDTDATQGGIQALGKAIPNALVVEFKQKSPVSNYEQKFRIQLTNAEFSNIADYAGGKSYGSNVRDVVAGGFKDPALNYDGRIFVKNTLWADTILFNGVAVSAGAFNLQLDNGDPDTATVTIPQNFSWIAGDTLSIPLPMEIDDIEEADVSVAIIENNSQVSAGTYLISRTTKNATKTTVKEIKTGREILALEDIIIKEKLIGSFSDLNTVVQGFELVAPGGYEFIGSSFANTTVIGTGDIAGLQKQTITFNPNVRDNSAIRVIVQNSGSMTAGSSTRLPESIIVRGLQIQPIDDDNIPFGNTLSMSIYKYEVPATVVPVFAGIVGLKGLTEESFDAAKPVDWTVSVTAATAKDVVTGRYDVRVDANEQIAAKATFKELEIGAWISERTTDFVLPEGVSIRGVKFDTWKEIKQGNPASSMVAAPGAGTSVIDKDKWSLTVPQGTGGAAGVLTIEKNTMSLKGIEVNTDKKAEIAFTLYVSISPEFKGETVTLSTKGTAIQQEVPDVVIANCVQPITVSAKVTDVQIGFQKYAVADITIKENKAGAILRNALVPYGIAPQGLVLYVNDYISSESDAMDLVPVKESQVTVDGDLKVTLRKNTSGYIAFDVDRFSTKASTITIKGVELKIDRTVPYGTYDLVVAGQSVFANEADTARATLEINALHDAYGYTIPYINVATEGMNSPLKANVKIAKDSDIVIVDGVQQQMAFPTYFDPNQESFLVPARFISHIFGVEENNIFWNDSTKTVSIITANRTLQFTANSDVMVVGANGAPSNVTMTAKAILHPVTERLYVPFRAIGNAFGVSVDYDEATQMAEYNKVK